jgi:hypothetical protein
MIFNKQYTKEEYEKKKKEMKLNTHEGIDACMTQVRAVFRDGIYKYADVKNNENTIGDHVYNAKNAYYCFDSKDLEDCRYCAKLSLSVKNAMDYNSWGDKAELVYQCTACGDNIYNMKWCTTCTSNLHDCEYADLCTRSNNLFGCVGLKNKQYCILNKQYTKEEYESLYKKLVEYMSETGEYGEFFPASICPFGYNESMAMEAFPLTKDEALSQGFRWQDELPFTRGKETVSFNDIPQSSQDIDSAKLTDQILACTQCTRNYKLIKQELEFYMANGIPVPRACPNCRHASRMALRNPMQLWNRQCMCSRPRHGSHGDTTSCPNTFETTYAPDRSEQVYCAECYQQEVL